MNHKINQAYKTFDLIQQRGDINLTLRQLNFLREFFNEYPYIYKREEFIYGEDPLLYPNEYITDSVIYDSVNRDIRDSYLNKGYFSDNDLIDWIAEQTFKP